MVTQSQNPQVQRFLDKTAKVAVLGMGYVGLPLATVFAEAGFDVTGIDPIQSKVDLLNQGISYIGDVSTPQVARLVSAGRLRATSDYAVLKDMDAVSICVPTPLRKFGDPDLSFIISAMDGLAPYLHQGMVIVLEFDHLPRHHPRVDAARPDAGHRHGGRQRFLPGLLA